MAPKSIKIHFITGKGGVGKSSVAAAYALSLSRKGRRVLLAELGEFSRYAEIYDVPEIGQKPLEIRPRFSIAAWSGSNCLKEYALHLLKIETIYRLFFENQVSRTLINIAPGLKELSIMGKITSGPPRMVGPPLDYDDLVVDAFATGHFVALLRAPKGMAQAVSFGPMGEQSRAIDQVLRNPEICSYHIVMIPEELPVLEGLELSSEIEREVGASAQFLLNKVYPKREIVEAQGVGGSGPSGLSPEFARELDRQAQKAIDARDLLGGKKFSVELPFVFESDAARAIEMLAGAFP